MQTSRTFQEVTQKNLQNACKFGVRLSKLKFSCTVHIILILSIHLTNINSYALKCITVTICKRTNVLNLHIFVVLKPAIPAFPKFITFLLTISFPLCIIADVIKLCK